MAGKNVIYFTLPPPPKKKKKKKKNQRSAKCIKKRATCGILRHIHSPIVLFASRFVEFLILPSLIKHKHIATSPSSILHALFYNYGGRRRHIRQRLLCILKTHICLKHASLKLLCQDSPCKPYFLL